MAVHVFGYRGGVHLDMRVFGFVSLEVNLEVAFGGETIATDVAFERTLT